MSYLVLARKYRPKNFSEMRGQEHVVQALSNALTTQRLHHAYLFTGTRGVGKTTVSRILAKSLNCTGADGTGGITATPCGVCSSCSEIDAGRFVDYTELDAASNRGVEEVQGLLEQAIYKPVQGRFKVFMIDEVHMLTNTAFNAMLKTLEEPPQYLKFVLATTDPQKVPVTVLSRCLQFNLKPMVPDTVFSHLQQVLQAEQITAQPAALHLLARAARGSMRDALSLTDQAIAYSASLDAQSGEQPNVSEQAVRLMLGSVDSTYVLRLIESLANNAPATLLQVVQTLQEHGLSAVHTLEEMVRILQRMAVCQYVPENPSSNSTGTDDPEQAEVMRLSTLMPADEVQLLYSLCLHGRDELGLAPDEYAGLTMVLLRLLAFKPGAEKKTLAAPNVAAPVSTAPPTPVKSAHVHVATSAASDIKTSVAPPVYNEPPPWEDAAHTPAARPQGTTDAATGKTTPSPATSVQHEPSAQATQTPHSPDLTLPVLSQTEPGQAFKPQTSSAPRTDEQRLVPTELGDFWYTFAQKICRKTRLSGMPRELLLQSQLMQHEAPTPEVQQSLTWILRVENETINHEPSRQKLEQLLSEEAASAVVLHIEYGRVVDSPSMRAAASRHAAKVQAESVFNQHPFVQSMMQNFGAKILPNSITFAVPTDAVPPVNSVQ